MIFMTISSYGQLRSPAQIVHQGIGQMEVEEHHRQVLETVHYPTFGDECAREVCHRWCCWMGPCFWMNFLGDLEKAQRLEFNGSDQFVIVGAMVYFERTRTVGDGVINCKVYSSTPLPGPRLPLKDLVMAYG